ncbi:MAG: tRNA-specific adenosine deaminase [Desulfobulbaceae bacterium]|nr:MAG: tRNA-specific adenosine deaminase [Desulfobulbaceae bacterium]
MKNEHDHYMQEALYEAAEALAKGEFPVGCVITRNRRIVARAHRTNSRDHANELDHAEVTALRHLFRQEAGTSDSPLTIYSTMEPCLMCFATLILNNVRTIVYGYEDAMGGGTGLDLSSLPPLYRTMKISVIPHVMRQESLVLFKEFFSNPAFNYWPDSLLADYTLKQP